VAAAGVATDVAATTATIEMITGSYRVFPAGQHKILNLVDRPLAAEAVS
jgi:hypothetical protein